MGVWGPMLYPCPGQRSVLSWLENRASQTLAEAAERSGISGGLYHLFCLKARPSDSDPINPQILELNRPYFVYCSLSTPVGLARTTGDNPTVGIVYCSQFIES